MNESDSPQFERRWYQFSLRSLLVFMLVVVLAIAWIAWIRGIQQRDERNIQGSWRSAEFPEIGTIVLDQGRMQIHSPFTKIEPESIMYEIDARTTPKQFDVIFDWGSGDGPKTLHGIYRLSDESLIICYPFDPNISRPTNFEHADAERILVLKLERVRDE